MNVAIWVIAGGILGWIAYTVVKANEDRGMGVLIIIGIVGGIFRR